MTEDEENRLVDKILEKLILNLPSIIGNIIQEKISMKKLAGEFYTSNKEFIEHKDIVASVLTQLETKNPGLQYQDILDKSVPEIKHRISLLSGINFGAVDKPNSLEFKQVISTSSNGEI